MVKIEALDQGNLNVKLSHMSGASDLITSAPLDNGGDGQGFSPTDLLAGFLGFLHSNNHGPQGQTARSFF